MDNNIDSIFADGQSNVEVQLITRKYVEKGSSATLYCRHNVDLDILYKVRNIFRLFVIDLQYSCALFWACHELN